MIWDESKRYTYADYLKWKEARYRGMELMDGIPYQYGVSVFEEEPVRFPPETIQKIVGNIFEGLSTSLKDTANRVLRSHPVILNGDAVVPDLTVINDHNDIILIAEIAESEKYRRLDQCKDAGIHSYWVIYPDSQCISVFVTNERELSGGVYGEASRFQLQQPDGHFMSMRYGSRRSKEIRATSWMLTTQKH